MDAYTHTLGLWLTAPRTAARRVFTEAARDLDVWPFLLAAVAVEPAIVVGGAAMARANWIEGLLLLGNRLFTAALPYLVADILLRGVVWLRRPAQREGFTFPLAGTIVHGAMAPAIGLFFAVGLALRVSGLVTGRHAGALGAEGMWLLGGVGLLLTLYVAHIALSAAAEGTAATPEVPAYGESTGAPAVASYATTAGAAVLALGLALPVWDVARAMLDYDRIVPAGPGKPVPAVEVLGAEGTERVNLAELARGQVTIIEFWATWCGPCQATMPEVEDLRRQFASQGVRVIAVNRTTTEESLAAARQFVREQAHGFTYVFDASDAAARAMRVQLLPTIFVVNKNGVILSLHLGRTAKSTLATAVAEALRGG